MGENRVPKLNIENLSKNKNDILKTEIGTLLFNLGKTHIGFWDKGRELVPDKNKFMYQYGYKPFTKYKAYFRKATEVLPEFQGKSYLEIDLLHHKKNGEDFEHVKKLFNETDVNFCFGDGNCQSLKLIDVLNASNAENGSFLFNIMMRGCESVNSGIDKGAPTEELNTLYIANAFGSFKEKINEVNFDKRRICFFKNIDNVVRNSSKETNENKWWTELRKYLINEVRDWYSHLLSDSRFPVNDVTLWDQVYMTASLFKATLAAICLEDEKFDKYMNNPSSIRWSILGVQYDKIALAEKAMNPTFIRWYRNTTIEVDNKVKEIIEEKFALGNEIYRDETGIYFIVPENITGINKDDSKLYNLNPNLKEIQDKIVKCFDVFEKEVFPAVFLTEPSRGIMNLAYLLEKAKDNFLQPIFTDEVKAELIETPDDIGKFKVLCDVCKVRTAQKDEKEDLNLCSKCNERKDKSSFLKQENGSSETIWTGELQDRNSRIALITVKFELDEWLNGDMLNTMLINDRNYTDEKEKIKKLLLELRKTYSIPESPFDNKEHYRLEKYKEFAESSEVSELIDNFLCFFDADGIKKPYKNVLKYFCNNPKESQKLEVFNTFDKYFYPFLDEIKSDKYVDIFIDFINKDEDYTRNSIKDLFNLHAPKYKNEIKRDWGEEPLIVARGIFSFAYVTGQIKKIILERTIGDRWESMISAELHNKVDFKNRKIKWDELSDSEIEFFAKLTFQFLIRKNPSPARLRRIWETSSKFLTNLHNNLVSILEIPSWRCKRLKISKENFEVIEGNYSKNSEFNYRGLEFLSDDAGHLYLISSIEKAIPILSDAAGEDKDDEIRWKINNNDTTWIKDTFELINVRDSTICKIKIKKDKNKLKYINYMPYLALINPTPISWQFIIPAEYAPNLIKQIQEEYAKEFKYVVGKLPLHIGVIMQNYKKPLYIGIKALRSIRRDIDSWKAIEEICEVDDLHSMGDKTIYEEEIEDDIENKNKRFYSLYSLENSNSPDYEFIINPDECFFHKVKSVQHSKKEEKFRVYLNTIDFEFIDVNTRRNDIYYDERRAKRILNLKMNRPYSWVKWDIFDEFKEFFEGNELGTRLQNTITLIYSKLDEWGSDDESIKRLMISAFANIFELNKNSSFADEFAAKVFGYRTWSEMKNKFNIKDEYLINDIYRYLDMYDFWHNGLKSI